MTDELKMPTRRTIVQGLAWSVPVVAASQITPAYAASVNPQCVPLAWSKSTTDTNSLGSVTHTITDGDTRLARAVDYFADGFNYDPTGAYTGGLDNLTKTSNGFAIAGWGDLDPVTRKDAYIGAEITLEPDAGFPQYFTVSDITSQSGLISDDNGANYYTDKIQVLLNGTVLTPISTRDTAITSDGWVSAVEEGSGAAQYEIKEPGTLLILLSNAYTGETPSTAHPNQFVLVSDFSCVKPDPFPTPTCAPRVVVGGGTFWRALDTQFATRMQIEYNQEFTVTGLPAEVTVTSINTTTWFKQRESSQPGGYDIPSWNSNSSGIGVSDRRDGDPNNLGWPTTANIVPGRDASSGWSEIVTSTATSQPYTFDDKASGPDTTANAWNINMSWSAAADDGKATYTRDATGCNTFTSGNSGNWVNGYTDMQATDGTARYETSYMTETLYTITLSNGCTLQGKSGSVAYPTNDGASAYLDGWHVRTKATC